MELINDTIGKMLTDRARSTPNNIGLYYNEETYTWREIDQITNGLCCELIELGVKPGDYIGIMGSNSASWVFYYLSVVKIGAIAVLFSTRFKEAEIERGIHLTNLKYLVYSEGYKDQAYDQIIRDLQKKELSVASYLYMERSEEQWKKIAVSKNLAEQNRAGDCKNVASILFTSGTTNNSKGVQLTHYNLLNNARSMVESMHWNEKDKMCIAVPLFHCFGVTACILSCVASGAAMMMMRSFRSLDVCQAIQDHKCTVLNGVPSMFLAMYRNEGRAQYDISTLSSGIIAGSPIFGEEYMNICSMFQDIKLQPSYGQTETSPCVTIADYNDSLEVKATSAGKAIEHVQIRICPINSSKENKVGIEGEIHVKGYNVMKGYIGNPEETSKTFTQDGWLKTGDLGYIDQQGYLHVTGRCKNLIIRGGENISPVEIESCIKEVAKENDVKVFGIPSAVLQEDIVACLEGEEIPRLRNSIQEHLEKNLSDYKIPKHIYFIKEMPRSGTGKIDEKLLKDHILSKIYPKR